MLSMHEKALIWSSLQEQATSLFTTIVELESLGSTSGSIIMLKQELEDINKIADKIWEE